MAALVDKAVGNERDERVERDGGAQTGELGRGLGWWEGVELSFDLKAEVGVVENPGEDERKEYDEADVVESFPEGEVRFLVVETEIERIRRSRNLQVSAKERANSGLESIGHAWFIARGFPVP